MEAAAAVRAAHSRPSVLPMTVSESSQGSVQRRSPHGVLRELDSDVYEFDKVLRRRKRGGVEESLIQWRGTGKKYASWEPRSNVVSGEFPARHARIHCVRVIIYVMQRLSSVGVYSGNEIVRPKTVLQRLSRGASNLRNLKIYRTI